LHCAASSAKAFKPHQKRKNQFDHLTRLISASFVLLPSFSAFTPHHLGCRQFAKIHDIVNTAGLASAAGKRAWLSPLLSVAAIFFNWESSGNNAPISESIFEIGSVRILGTLTASARRCSKLSLECPGHAAA